MKWMKWVVVPLAIIAVVIGIVFRLFGWAPFGIAPKSYLDMANTLFLVIIVWLLFRIDRKSEII